MEQESKYKVCIVGGGPAGCTCAYFLQNNYDVFVIDKKEPLTTLFPTGGGRCNLAHAEYDFKKLASYYPRGEKFLYSVFAKFATQETLDFFKTIGVDTYIQEDGCIFPVSNSSEAVREKFIKALGQTNFIQAEVLKIDKNENRFCITTNEGFYHADFVVVSTGGHSSFDLLKQLGHNIIPLKPSLTGLKAHFSAISEKDGFPELSGISIDNILFTHKGLSGPAIYKISSLKARDAFPYKLNLDFISKFLTDKELNRIQVFQNLLNSNPHKSIKNLLGEYLPKSFAEYVLNYLNIDINTKCHLINGKMRDKILNQLTNFEIEVTGTVPDGEVVMSGGVDLKEVNSKTMGSKIVDGLFFCGEVLDIDGFCGGFNLQNCWSTGYLASMGIMF